MPDLIESPYRKATPADAAALAEFVNMSGEGMALYLWDKMAVNSSDTAWQIGAQRAQRESGGFSYRHSIVRDENNAPVAGLIGYPLPAEPDPQRFEGLPAMFVPLQELEDLVRGTWYINVLATLESYRGRGFGKDLLRIAANLAAATGCNGLSLIVADNNEGARRLYVRNGYEEIATRPMIKEDWVSAGENWILLKKPL
jgi:ribosomal protein S18 acetylase RimI-like enzyme